MQIWAVLDFYGPLMNNNLWIRKRKQMGEEDEEEREFEKRDNG